MTTIDTAIAYLPRRALFDAQSDSPKRDIWQRISGLLNEPVDRFDAVWDDLFSRSEHALLMMAEEAREDRRTGRTQILDPDAL